MNVYAFFYSTVFLCKQISDNKLVITKEIPVDQMSVEERQVSMNEAKVLAMLDHPNVIAYYDSFLEDKTMIIVMEYVQGTCDSLVLKNCLLKYTFVKKNVDCL